MKYRYALIITVLCFMFFSSCTKQEKGATFIVDGQYFISASMQDSGSSAVSSFMSDTCRVYDVINGTKRFIGITGYTNSSSCEINSVYIEIDNYTGPGSYMISNDSNNYVTAYFDVLVPASSGPTYMYIQATDGSISISSEVPGKAQGTYKINSGRSHFSGNFFISVNN